MDNQGTKIKIAVLMGGRSPEYEISLISGREVVKNLDKSKYEVLPIVISRTGKGWQLISKEKIDLVFIAMHGPYGEDGTLQGMLDFLNLPYTGSKVLASALAMDKLLFRRVLKSENIPVPRFVVVKKGEPGGRVFKDLGDPPYFIKPHNQGSSIGTSIVESKEDLDEALGLAFRYSETALVDEYIKGTEVTCGVLGNKKPEPLPLVEIIPRKSRFFDYQSKYLKGGAREIAPARISKRLTRRIKEIALVVYRLIGCRGFSRVDFILRKAKEPLVLEINTIPGLTPMSLLPKAAGAAGISYSQLLDKIIKYALE